MRKKARQQFVLGKATRITCGFTDHEHPVVSPDGKYVAYYFGEYGSLMIAVADRVGRLMRVISPLGGNSTQPAWSPGGDKLAYRYQPTNSAKWELWESVLLESVKPRQLLASPEWHYKHPCYHPTAQSLAYFSDESTPGIFHIWEFDLSSLAKRQLTHGSGSNHCHPAYSPDGQRILFHAYAGTDESKVPAITNLFELDLLTNELRQLTTGVDQYKHPFYLTKSLITFHHEDNSTGERELCLMDLRSLAISKLTSGGNNDKHPFPYRVKQGKAYLAYASKRQGLEKQVEPSTYDIFIAELIRGKE